MSFVDAAIARARTTISVLIFILITGAYVYSTIPKESSPDIPIPLIYVSVTLQGVSPEDSERLILRPLEQELRSIEGIKEMRSTAYQGGGNVVLEFDAGFDSDTALTDVREAVDIAKPDLPETAEEPVVTEVNFSQFPVLVITLAGPVSEASLLNVARDLQDNIEALPQILEARIVGEREEVVEILVDPSLVEGYRLNPRDFEEFLNLNNKLVAAGVVDTGQGRFAIKVPGLLENAEDILQMPVKISGEGVVRVKDIATVQSTFKDADRFTRLNGQPAMVLEIVKRSGENVIDTIDDVKKIVTEEQKFWPEGVTVAFSQDKSDRIRDMLRDLQNNVITAILLVMIVIVAALGLRPAALVGVAIPGSFLLGILLLWACGYTVNMVVLFSLILSVGILVDGAVVVVELADRYMTQGQKKVTAYANASKRMAWPIIASTLTTLAAFLPLIFWPGITGEFMKFLPITVTFVLMASLLMALIFVPTVGALLGQPNTVVNHDLSMQGLVRRYEHILKIALQKPWLAMVGAAASLVVVLMIYGMFGKGVEFFPSIEPDSARIQVHTRGNLSVNEQDVLVKQVEEKVFTVGGLKSVYTVAGEPSQGGRSAPSDLIGTINLEFDEWDQRPPARDILDEILKKAAGIPGIYLSTEEEKRGPESDKPIQIEIASRQSSLIEPTIAKMRDAMEQMGGFQNTEDDRPVPGIEWEFKVDRAQASKFGVSVTAVGEMIKMATRGIILDTYRPDHARDEVDIIARFPPAYRNLEQLDKFRVTTPNGLVPVSSFVTKTPQQKVSIVHRVDSKRVMTIKSDVQAGVLANDKLKELQAWVAQGNLPDGVQVVFKGQNERQQESSNFLKRAFLVALAIMAIILVTQFNSFYSMFLILSAVIMSTVGVFIGLLILGQPFGIVMGGIGVIALAGVVVNNNIVLIDTFDVLKKEMSVYDAIVETGRQRLRPVMLTTVTTILGLLPMTAQVNIDFITREVSMGAPSTQWWVQLSAAIVFGLAFATILTLIVTPCALMWKEQMMVRVRAWKENR